MHLWYAVTMDISSGVKNPARGNCPYSLVAEESGVRVIMDHNFLITKIQAVTQVNLGVTSRHRGGEVQMFR